MFALPRALHHFLLAAAVAIGLGLVGGYVARAWMIESALATPAGQRKLAEEAYRTGDERLAIRLYRNLALL